MSLLQRWQTRIALGKESSWATTVADTSRFAIMSPKPPQEKFKNINDTGYRSLAAKDYGYYQGVGWSEWDLSDMYFYPDDSGHFFMGILGLDTATSSGATTSHAIGLSTTGTPPSYTLQYYDGNNTRLGAGCYFSEVNLKWATDSDLKISVKATGQTPTTSGTAPSTAYSSESILVPWNLATTLNGLGTTRIIDCDMTLKRTITPVFGASTSQQCTDISVAELEFGGKMTLYVANDTEFNYFRNNTQGIARWKFIQGTRSLLLTATSTAFEDPGNYDLGKDYKTLSLTWKGLYNATDAGPVAVTLVNARGVF